MRISMRESDPGYEPYMDLRVEGKDVINWTLDGKNPIDEHGDTVYAITLDDEEGYALVYAPRDKDGKFKTDEHGNLQFIELRGEIVLTIEEVLHV